MIFAGAGEGIRTLDPNLGKCGLPVCAGSPRFIKPSDFNYLVSVPFAMVRAKSGAITRIWHPIWPPDQDPVCVVATWLSGPSVFRVNGIVRETLTSGSGAVLPSDVVTRVAALAREALLADAGTFRVAAVVREVLVSEAQAPPAADEAPRFWTTILA